MHHYQIIRLSHAGLILYSADHGQHIILQPSKLLQKYVVATCAPTTRSHASCVPLETSLSSMDADVS